MRSTNLWGDTQRRVGIVVGGTAAFVALAVALPSTVVLTANAAVPTATTTSTSAGEVTAMSLTPVIAASSVVTTTSRLATTSRTLTRVPVVAPYAFGTRAYNKWWARYYMVHRYSWTSTTQYQCLVNLWSHESGWSHKAYNRYSGAYGIPQALPGRKMAVFGGDWRTNPRVQIRWGLSYIHGRYGTPCRAWRAFQYKGWY